MNVVSTYRKNASASFGSDPDAGPNRRHHSNQCPVRARIPSRVRSGIRSAIAVSRSVAVSDTGAARRRLRLGTPLSSMTRSVLSGYPESHSQAWWRSRASRSARNPAPSAGMPTSAQNDGSSRAHSSTLSSWSAQLAYASPPVTAMSPVRSSSAR